MIIAINLLCYIQLDREYREKIGVEKDLQSAFPIMYPGKVRFAIRNLRNLMHGGITSIRPGFRIVKGEIDMISASFIIVFGIKLNSNAIWNLLITDIIAYSACDRGGLRLDHKGKAIAGQLSSTASYLKGELRLKTVSKINF